MKIFFLALLLTCLTSSVKAQSGCTDPQALNFNATATENDGSCTYPPTTYAPVQIAELPETLEESSGLAWFNDRLWTHLDGGNPERLYVLDTLTGAQLQMFILPGSENIDWEDLAEDNDHLYIGDFGNNDGDRTDLKIYKIPKAQLNGGAVFGSEIQFTFSDQTDFTHENNAHNYDCEAFFFWNDSLHLFSKNWTDFKTRHYVLPTTPGLHVAQLRDSLTVQGQITGADITADGTAALLGYNANTSEAFLWLLFDFPDSHFFDGNKRKISLGSALTVSQVEGIAFRNHRYGYLCAERFSVLPARLMAFDIGQWTGLVSSAGEAAQAERQVAIAPNPCGSFFELLLPEETSAISLTISDLSGKIFLKKTEQALSQTGILRIETATWPAGLYLLEMQDAGGRRYAGRVVVDW